MLTTREMSPKEDQKNEHEQVDVSHLEALSNPANANHPNARAIISEDERNLVRKLDMKILPYMCAVGFLQFLDKTSLSYASVLGLIQDTHLQGSEYGLLGSLFYVGYLSMQVGGKLLKRKSVLGLN